MIDTFLPIYRVKRNRIKGLRIYVVIGGFSLLADALLRGSSLVQFRKPLVYPIRPSPQVVRNKLQNVNVKLPDGRSFRGKVTALDIATDLAIVKLEGVRDKLPSMKLGVVAS